MTEDKKREVLLISFETLKNDFINYSNNIQNLMAQVMDFDPEMVVEMWHYLINNNQELMMKDNSSYGKAYALLGGMVRALAEKSSFLSFKQYLLRDNILLEAIYGNTPDISGSMLQLINDLIRDNRLVEANKLLQLLYDNHIALSNNPFSSALHDLIEEYLLADREYGNNMYRTKDTREYSLEV